MNDTLQAPGGKPASPPARLLYRLLGRGRTGFYVAAGIVLAVVLGSGYGLYRLIELRIDYQEQRNAYLKGETDKLEAQLTELGKQRKEAMAVQERGQDMQNLYNARATAAGMFNFLAREIPPGVQLTYAGLDQGKLKLRGYARSRAEVTGLMGAIEASPWLDKPALISSAEHEERGQRLQEFAIEAKAGRFHKPAATGKSKRDGEKGNANSAAPDNSDNTAAWAATGMGIGLALLSAGWLIRRWRSKRAAAGGKRATFFERSAAQFDALDPHDLPSWGVIPRVAVLLELALAAGVAAWLVVDTAFDEYSNNIMVEEKLKTVFLEDKRKVVNLDLLLKQLTQIKQDYARVIDTFPARVNPARLDAGIRYAARKAGISLVRTDLDSATRTESFLSFPVRMRLVGNFDGIGAFIGNAMKMEGVVTLQGFELTADEPGSKGGKDMKLRLTVTLVAHAGRPDSMLEITKGAKK